MSWRRSIWRMGFTLLVLAFASMTFGAEAPAAAIPVEQWLAGPERQDYAWSVKVEPAALTYQQRFLVRVVAVVKARALRRPDGEHDFSLVVKVADAGGNWLAGQDEANLAVKPPQLKRLDEFSLAADVLLRPGQFTLAAILYDRIHQNGNVTRVPVLVAPVEKDPLPELARDLPAADFPTEEPRPGSADTGSAPSPAERARRTLFTPTRSRSLHYDRRSFSDRGIAWLPVDNRYPLVIDLVVNFSSPYQDEKTGASTEAYRANAGLMLQVGNVLSQLRTARGCVRVSAVDISRQRILAEDLDGGTLDWKTLRETVIKADVTTVDVHTLRDRYQGAAFFRTYLAQLGAGHASCGLSPGQYKRAIIIASTGVVFPVGTQIERLDPVAFSDVAFYHVRPVISAGADWDQLEAIFRPVSPLRIKPSSPLQFRKGIAAIIADLEKVTAATPVVSR